jgi:hypothetical protein
VAGNEDAGPAVFDNVSVDLLFVVALADGTVFKRMNLGFIAAFDDGSPLLMERNCGGRVHRKVLRVLGQGGLLDEAKILAGKAFSAVVICRSFDIILSAKLNVCRVHLLVVDKIPLHQFFSRGRGSLGLMIKPTDGPNSTLRTQTNRNRYNNYQYD